MKKIIMQAVFTFPFVNRGNTVREFAFRSCCLFVRRLSPERWAGVANSDPGSPANPHRTLRCMLAGERATLLATPG